MDSFDHCLDKFETQLRQHIETEHYLKDQTNQLSRKLVLESEQCRHNRYQAEADAHRSRLMNDQLAKKESELKVEFEKKLIEVNEEKHLNSIQLQRTLDQMNRLKQELSSLQAKNLHLELVIAQTKTQIKKDNGHKANIRSELSWLKKRTNAMDIELKSLTKSQMQFKAMADSAQRFNAQLRNQLNENNETIVSLNRDINRIQTVSQKLRNRLSLSKQAISEKDSQYRTLNNQFDLLKNNYMELKEFLSKTLDENAALMKRLNRFVKSDDCGQQTERLVEVKQEMESFFTKQRI